MQDRGTAWSVGSLTGHGLFLPFVFALLGALASQQFPVDVRNLIEVIFQLMVVVDQLRTSVTFSSGTIPPVVRPGPRVTVRYQIGPWRSPLAHLQAGFPQVT